jgi:ABC-type Zn uptake system ZnuABC Zn-binding protein ZnuA
MNMDKVANSQNDEYCQRITVREGKPIMKEEEMPDLRDHYWASLVTVRRYVQEIGILMDS